MYYLIEIIDYRADMKEIKVYTIYHTLVLLFYTYDILILYVLKR